MMRLKQFRDNREPNSIRVFEKNMIGFLGRRPSKVKDEVNRCQDCKNIFSREITA